MSMQRRSSRKRKAVIAIQPAKDTGNSANDSGGGKPDVSLDVTTSSSALNEDGHSNGVQRADISMIENVDNVDNVDNNGDAGNINVGSHHNDGSSSSSGSSSNSRSDINESSSNISNHSSSNDNNANNAAAAAAAAAANNNNNNNNNSNSNNYDNNNNNHGALSSSSSSSNLDTAVEKLEEKCSLDQFNKALILLPRDVSDLLQKCLIVRQESPIGVAFLIRDLVTSENSRKKVCFYQFHLIDFEIFIIKLPFNVV